MFTKLKSYASKGNQLPCTGKGEEPHASRANARPNTSHWCTFLNSHSPYGKLSLTELKQVDPAHVRGLWAESRGYTHTYSASQYFPIS